MIKFATEFDYKGRKEPLCWIYNNDWKECERIVKENWDNVADNVRDVIIVKQSTLKRLLDKT